MFEDEVHTANLYSVILKIGIVSVLIFWIRITLTWASGSQSSTLGTRYLRVFLTQRPGCRRKFWPICMDPVQCGREERIKEIGGNGEKKKRKGRLVLEPAAGKQLAPAGPNIIALAGCRRPTLRIIVGKCLQWCTPRSMIALPIGGPALLHPLLAY